MVATFSNKQANTSHVRGILRGGGRDGARTRPAAACARTPHSRAESRHGVGSLGRLLVDFTSVQLIPTMIVGPCVRIYVRESALRACGRECAGGYGAHIAMARPARAPDHFQQNAAW